jgi:hypothetical protein
MKVKQPKTKQLIIKKKKKKKKNEKSKTKQLETYNKTNNS